MKLAGEYRIASIDWPKKRMYMAEQQAGIRTLRVMDDARSAVVRLSHFNSLSGARKDGARKWRPPDN